MPSCMVEFSYGDIMLLGGGGRGWSAFTLQICSADGKLISLFLNLTPQNTNELVLIIKGLCPLIKHADGIRLWLNASLSHALEMQWV